jgi:gliding motility-associated-like protein
MVPDQILCSGDSLTLYASGASSYIWKDLNNNVICANCTTTTVKPNKSTSFQVIGFSEFGCSNIASTVIRVIQPFKLLVTSPDTICVGDSKRLLVTGGSTYNWRADPGLSNINSATPIVSPKSTTTFHVTAKDSYKCFTDSADIKIVVGKPTPFNIGMDTAVLSGTPVQLHAFSNSNDIKKWQWRGNATFSCLSCEAPTAKVIFDECLNCTATNIYGCVSTDTVCIKTFCPTSEVFIPNAFSPDGDGINDVLIVQGRGLKMVKSFRIYNRWGELVFERSNFYPGDASSGWNGKVRGSMPSPDVFVYVCEVICERGVPATFKGNVAIIK